DRRPGLELDEPALVGQPRRRLGALASRLPVAAELVEPGAVEQGMRLAERMAELPRQREGLGALPARLLGLTAELQRPGAVAEGTHAGIVVAVHGGEPGVPIGIVESQRLARVLGGSGKLAPREARGPQRVVRLDQLARISAGPGQAQ